MVTGSGPTLLDKIASGAGTVAKLAMAVAPAISAINTEHKYFDVASTDVAYNPGTNDTMTNLTQGIAQGTTDITRIGNSILAKDINIRAYVFWAASTTIHFGVSRVILFVWKENLQDNPPTVAKLFEAPTQLTSAYNKDYTDQFVVLKDKLISHNANISAATGQAVSIFRYYKKLNWHMRFDAGSTGDGTVNHIYLLIRGGGATSANQSSITYNSRLNFTDN